MTSISIILKILINLFIGWPIYLLGFANSPDMLAHDGTPLRGQLADHFRPNLPLFPRKLAPLILLSTMGIVAGLMGLIVLSYNYGFLRVWLLYWAPLMWVNFLLVLVTILQHTNQAIQHYGESKWTWIDGALSTIDRPYGIFDYLHHNIGSTHVAHHLFHTIPFYHAIEATVAIKKVLGSRYNYDSTPIPVAIWNVTKNCQVVDSVEGVQYYRPY